MSQIETPAEINTVSSLHILKFKQIILNYMCINLNAMLPLCQIKINLLI